MNPKTVYTLLCHGTHHSESSGEFTLPDYLPDVRRVLRVTADPHVTGKYMTGERLELEGEVRMTLLYLSEESSVCAFSAVLPFSQSIAVPSLDETAIITAHLSCDTAACRLLGPRKCVLRTKPALYVRAASRRDITPDTASLSAEVKDTLCLRTHSYPAADLVCVSRGDLRYADDLSVGTDGTVTAVLSCTVTPLIRECRAVSGGVICKGEFVLSALCSLQETGGNVCRALTGRLPFSETLDDAALTDAFRCEPDLCITNVTPTVIEDGRALGVDFSCELAVLCTADTEIPVITDAFSAKNDIRLTEEPCTVFRPLKTVIGAMSAAAALKFDPADPPKAVTDACITVRFDRTEKKDGRLQLDGTMECTLLCSCEDGSYQPLSATVPVHWDTDGSAMPDASSLLLHSDCSVSSYSTRIDTTAGTVFCDAELSVLLTAAAKEIRSLPRALTVPSDTPSYPVPSHPLMFCYPEEGECLWDIAKRYRIPPAVIAATNGLDPNTEVCESKTPLVIAHHPVFAKKNA